MPAKTASEGSVQTVSSRQWIRLVAVSPDSADFTCLFLGP